MSMTGEPKPGADGARRDDALLGDALSGVSIAVDARYLSRPGMGMFRYLHAGIETLLAADAEVTLLSNDNRGVVCDDFPTARWERFGSHRDVVWDQWDLPRHLRAHSYQYYWAPCNNGVPWWPLGRTTTVGTTHDLIPLRLWRTYLYRRPLFAIPYLIATASAIVRSDVLLTDSESSRRDIQSIFHRRAVVVPPNLFTGLRLDPPDFLPPQLAGAEYLIYTGGLDTRKNVATLLEAFAVSLQRHPQIRLVITGGGTERLKPVIASLGIADSVILTGLVSEEEKTVLLAGARALVYPSSYEGFGLPLLEAFAADVPVVTCSNSSLVEVAGDAAVYVDPRSADSIADGIAEVLRVDVAHELRTLGRRRLEQFDPLANRRQLVEVFTTSPDRRR